LIFYFLDLFRLGKPELIEKCLIVLLAIAVARKHIDVLLGEAFFN
jgi:hypothetical protein